MFDLEYIKKALQYIDEMKSPDIALIHPDFISEFEQKSDASMKNIPYLEVIKTKLVPYGTCYIITDENTKKMLRSYRKNQEIVFITDFYGGNL